MRRLSLILLLALPATAGTMTFESFFAPGNSAVFVPTPYFEDGLRLDLTGSSPGGHAWETESIGWAGSTGVGNNSLSDFGGGTTLRRADNGVFSLVSLEIAPNTPTTSVFEVTFIGIHPDQTTVQQTFQVNPVMRFQPLTFIGFSNLAAVNLPMFANGLFQVDNITTTNASVVPEPRTTILLLSAGFLVLPWLRRTRSLKG